MRVGKVKPRSSSHWSNKEVRRFELGCKRHGMHEGRPECDLLDGMNTRRRLF